MSLLKPISYLCIHYIKDKDNKIIDYVIKCLTGTLVQIISYCFSKHNLFKLCFILLNLTNILNQCKQRSIIIIVAICY